MISADVKAIKNHKKQNIWWPVSYLQIFIKKYLQHLKYNARACIFRLILIDVASILILSVNSRGVGEGGGLLNRQNLFTLKNVIC